MATSTTPKPEQQVVSIYSGGQLMEAFTVKNGLEVFLDGRPVHFHYWGEDHDNRIQRRD